MNAATEVYSHEWYPFRSNSIFSNVHPNYDGDIICSNFHPRTSSVQEENYVDAILLFVLSFTFHFMLECKANRDSNWKFFAIVFQMKMQSWNFDYLLCWIFSSEMSHKMHRPNRAKSIWKFFSHFCDEVVVKYFFIPLERSFQTIFFCWFILISEENFDLVNFQKNYHF